MLEMNFVSDDVRARVERDLKWAADQVRDMMGVVSLSAHPKDPLAGRHNYDLLRTVERHGEQIRDALQRLACLQPAPVVEDGTAREERCEYCDGTGDVHRADGEWLGECTACTAATLAPEVQNAEASLRAAAERIHFLFPGDQMDKVSAGALKASGEHEQLYAVNAALRVLAAALATAPAVPDGRTEEVEELIDWTKPLEVSRGLKMPVTLHTDDGDCKWLKVGFGIYMYNNDGTAVEDRAPPVRNTPAALSERRT
ncbi:MULTISPECIES: hypothetical protein [unclassified Aureimonas]|uniref:hypothetical protein n=1 Tax=unclassified Aureimonas TaxID=2615206 RepID=UPI0007005FBF|nr:MULTISPECIES: hypothetical protein [unclassified Aureimonas]KQT52172.1 hypothetical protein ASG62_16065 [Aureimonas sp. Leaf427]KQT70595.1 hypothetical protein ASG54_21885 [Aureimonas sp. Leaf460]